jgi:hypothetical protein
MTIAHTTELLGNLAEHASVLKRHIQQLVARIEESAQIDDEILVHLNGLHDAIEHLRAIDQAYQRRRYELTGGQAQQVGHALGDMARLGKG